MAVDAMDAGYRGPMFVKRRKGMEPAGCAGMYTLFVLAVWLIGSPNGQFVGDAGCSVSPGQPEQAPESTRPGAETLDFGVARCPRGELQRREEINKR